MANNLKEVVDSAYEMGKNQYSSFRKVSPIASGAGFWVDLSMATGNPKPNYYVGAELTSTPFAYREGIYHGGGVYPNTKYLHKMNILGTNAAVAPAPFILCDYLMYYPLIDMDSTDEQTLINYGPLTDTTNPSAAYLNRYSSGSGVKAFLVATNPYVGGASFQIKYTNQNGDQNRISQICVTNNQTFIGTIVNSNTAGLNNYGAFIELQMGDTGIRSVQSITFLAANGGLASLVLCRPIATIMTRDTTAWSEFDFFKDKSTLPVIYDGAYLNLLTMPSATIAAIPILGEATFIWG
jgi:hypothetical protein